MAKYDHFIYKKITPLGRWSAQIATKYFANQILKLNPYPKKVLEIGPGNGQLAELFLNIGCDYLAYESNKMIMENLKNKGIKVIHNIAPPLNEPNEQYDLVVSSHVFEHMKDSETAYQFLSEISRVLKTGGIAAIVAPNFNSWVLDFYDCDFTHCFEVTPNRLRQMFEDVGLEVKTLVNRYGNFGFFPGYFIDRLINSLFYLFRIIFPYNT